MLTGLPNIKILHHIKRARFTVLETLYVVGDKYPIKTLAVILWQWKLTPSMRYHTKRTGSKDGRIVSEFAKYVVGMMNIKEANPEKNWSSAGLRGKRRNSDNVILHKIIRAA